MSRLWTPYVNHLQEEPLDLTRRTTYIETPAGSGSSSVLSALSYGLMDVVPSEQLRYPPAMLPPATVAVPIGSPLVNFLPNYAETASTRQYYYSPELPLMQAYHPALSPKAQRRQLIPNNQISDDDISLSDDLEYQIFEQNSMETMAEKNGGNLLGENPRMRRAVQSQQTADDSYRRQRERNNLAAKQSRDRRKIREMRLAVQVSFLKKKLRDLKGRLAARVCSRCGVSCRSCNG